MQLLVDVQVSVLGGHIVAANGENVPLETQVFNLQTRMIEWKHRNIDQSTKTHFNKMKYFVTVL